jgi:hypothetical protein
MKWFGHLARMGKKKKESRAQHSKLSKYRAQGRIRKRWIEGITEVC